MSTLSGLHEAMSRLEETWAGAGDSGDLTRAQLIAVNDAIGVLRRRLEAVHVEVGAGIARESRPELGAQGLAKQPGWCRWVRPPLRAPASWGSGFRRGIPSCGSRWPQVR